MNVSRRGLVFGAAALLLPSQPRAEAPALTIGTRILDVKGKAAKVFGIVGPNGKLGLEMVLGQPFRVDLKNALDEHTAIHWHGLTPPASQDGVPHLSGPAIEAGETRAYDFENLKAGTHWMHSHLGLQEQRMLAAPLIVYETQRPVFDEQNHVVMLHDFSFKDPSEILAALKANGSTMNMSAVAGVDIAYDAMLANDRTLDDPEIVRAEKGGVLRLRIVNACAATNMWIDLGPLSGTLIAVDGNTISPLRGSRFPLAIAQRADVRVELPQGSGSWPIMFEAEGDTLRAGIILQAGDGSISKISDRGKTGASLDLHMESKLKSAALVLPEPVAHTEVVTLTGDEKTYIWGFNGKPMMHDVLFNVRADERVEVVIQNLTMMAHPIHIHGHYFKVVRVGNLRIDGAVRDTILIPAGERVAVQFDADNPGNWAFHCHHLYHMNSGMMAAIGYVGAA